MLATGTISHQPNTHQVGMRGTLQYQPQPMISIGSNTRSQPVAGTLQQQQQRIMGGSLNVGNSLQQPTSNAGKIAGMQSGIFNPSVALNRMVAASNHMKLPLLQPKPPPVSSQVTPQVVQVNQMNQMLLNNQQSQLQSLGLVAGQRNVSVHTGGQRQSSLQPQQQALVMSQMRQQTGSPLNQIASNQAQAISRPPSRPSSTPSALCQPPSRRTPTPTLQQQQQPSQSARPVSQGMPVNSALSQVLLTTAQPMAQQQRGPQMVGTVHHHSVAAKPENLNQSKTQLMQQLQRQTIQQQGLQQQVPAALQIQRVNVPLQSAQSAVNTSAAVTVAPSVSLAQYGMAVVSSQLASTVSSQLSGIYTSARPIAQQPQVRQVPVTSVVQHHPQWSRLQASHTQPLTVQQQQTVQSLQAHMTPTVQQPIQQAQPRAIQSHALSAVQQVRQIPISTVQQPVHQVQRQKVEKTSLQPIQSQLQTVQPIQQAQQSQLHTVQPIQQAQQSQLQTVQQVQQSQLQTVHVQQLQQPQLKHVPQVQRFPLQTEQQPKQLQPQSVQQTQLHVRQTQNTGLVQAVQHPQPQIKPQVMTSVPSSVTLSTLQPMQQSLLQREPSPVISTVQTGLQQQLQISQTQTSIQQVRQSRPQIQAGQTQSIASAGQTVQQPQLLVKQQPSLLPAAQIQQQLQPRLVQDPSQSHLRPKPAQTTKITPVVQQAQQSVKQPNVNVTVAPRSQQPLKQPNVNVTVQQTQQTQLQVKQPVVTQQLQTTQIQMLPAVQQSVQQPVKQAQVVTSVQLPVVQLQAVQTQSGQGQASSVQQLRLVTSSGSSFQLPNNQQLTLIQLQPGQQGQQFQTQTADGKVLQFRLVTGNQGSTLSNVRPVLLQGGSMKTVLTPGVQFQVGWTFSTFMCIVCVLRFAFRL